MVTPDGRDIDMSVSLGSVTPYNNVDARDTDMSVSMVSYGQLRLIMVTPETLTCQCFWANYSNGTLWSFFLPGTPETLTCQCLWGQSCLIIMLMPETLTCQCLGSVMVNYAL